MTAKNKENNVESEKLQETKELEEKNKDLIYTLQRLQAEFENYQKRTEKEKIDFIKLSNESLIISLLSVIDNFDLALTHLSKSENKELVSGINLIHNQLKSTLSKEGLIEIEALNQQFDPSFHEAIAKIPSEKEENTIIEVHQKGYLLNNKLIRPSKVIISGGIQNE